jgi:hypothetical protein
VVDVNHQKDLRQRGAGHVHRLEPLGARPPLIVPSSTKNAHAGASDQCGLLQWAEYTVIASTPQPAAKNG